MRPPPWITRPSGPFALNKDHWAYQGLVALWPAVPAGMLVDFGPQGGFHFTKNGPLWVNDPIKGQVPEFDDASSQYFEISSAVLTEPPITLVGFFYSDDLVLGQTLIDLGVAGSFNNSFELQFAGDVAGEPVRAFTRTTTNASASTTIAYSINTWHRACAVFASATSRAAYIDGGSKGTNTTSKAPSGINTAAIGRSAGPGGYLSGRIAEARIYKVAWPDALVALDAENPWELYYRLGLRKYFFLSGAQQFQQTHAETAALTEALARQVARTTGEALGLTEAKIRQAQKAIAETLAPTESLTAIVIKLKDVAETVSLTESLVKQVARATGETLGLTEEQIRQAQKALSETAGLTEALATSIVKLKDVADSVALTEALVKQAARATGETLGLTEDQISQIQKAFSETPALTEALTLLASKNFTETLALGESLAKEIHRAMGESLGLTEDLTIEARRVLAESIGFTDALLKQTARVTADALGLTELLQTQLITIPKAIRFTGETLKSAAFSAELLKSSSFAGETMRIPKFDSEKLI